MPDSQRSLTPDRASTVQPRLNQQNSTALKWGSDGELSQLDLERILNLLSQADPVAGALMGGRSDALG
jgi:hypothetical protein